jgi:hypothetical protein
MWTKKIQISKDQLDHVYFSSENNLGELTIWNQDILGPILMHFKNMDILAS